MQINKKNRRPSSLSEHKSKKPAADAARAPKLAPKKLDRKTERQDQIERKLRDEIEGTGDSGRVRDIVVRLLGSERSPAIEAMVARLQAAARNETTGPYGQ